MEYFEKVFVTTLFSIVFAFVLLGIFAICQDHTPEGYYHKFGDIYISIPWGDDQRACDYSDQKWEELKATGLLVGQE